MCIKKNYTSNNWSLGTLVVQNKQINKGELFLLPPFLLQSSSSLFFFYFTFPSFIIVFTSHLISWNKKTTSTKDCCASWPGLYSLLLSKNSIVKRYLATVAAYHCHCQHSAVGASSPQFPLTHHTQWDKPPPGEEVATTKPPLPCGKDIHPTLPPSGEAFNFHSPSCCPIKQPHVSL